MTSPALVPDTRSRVDGPVPVPPDEPDAAGAALTALCHALALYLSGLRAVWAPDQRPAGERPEAHAAGDDSEGAAGAEIARLVAATGFVPVPGPADRTAFAALSAVVTARAEQPFARLCGGLDLDLGARLTTAAAWWADRDPQFGVLLGCAHDDAAARYPTAGLLRLVLAPFGVDLPLAWESGDPLVHLGVLEPDGGARGPLQLTPAARRLLSGRRWAPRTGPEPLSPTMHPSPRRSALERMTALLRAGAVVVLRPETTAVDSDTLRSLANTAAAELGAWPLEGNDCSDAELRLLGRVGGALPVISADRLPVLRWSSTDGPLLAIGEPGSRVAGGHPVDVGLAGVRDRAAAWTQALRGAGVSERRARTAGRRLAARLLIDGPQVAAVVAHARVETAATGRVLTEDGVWDVARRTVRQDLQRVAVLVEPAFRLDDLVLTADVRAQLDEVVAHVLLQDVVLDRWGFRDRMPRGQGVAVLLSGPPGTGKTTAAEALAAELRQDLYRIDLSAVVSKYIGETEKNLAVAFDEAERASAVLFFDECDALFGRRTEHRDAHDRWANLQVNFLLQRVETFTGLVVLATNKRQALDEALLRRLRFSVRFEAPDTGQRARLWQLAFPSRTPSAALDVDRLAARELTGGSVQTVALVASFAAAAAGQRVGDSHLQHALRREYDKLGKVWTEGPT